MTATAAVMVVVGEVEGLHAPSAAKLLAKRATRGASSGRIGGLRRSFWGDAGDQHNGHEQQTCQHCCSKPERREVAGHEGNYRPVGCSPDLSAHPWIDHGLLQHPQLDRVWGSETNRSYGIISHSRCDGDSGDNQR